MNHNPIKPKLELQRDLPFITHNIGERLIHQRPKDGYINATAMCNACNKKFGHYWENINTKSFVEELSFDIGIPISEIIQIVKGGKPEHYLRPLKK